MIQLPWVARARYEQAVQDRAAALERERRALDLATQAVAAAKIATALSGAIENVQAIALRLDAAFPAMGTLPDPSSVRDNDRWRIEQLAGIAERE